MVKTKENLEQNYNDFHKKTYIPPVYQRDVGKKGNRKDKKKKDKGKTGKKNTFFPPICKKKGNSEVSANNVIN